MTIGVFVNYVYSLDSYTLPGIGALAYLEIWSFELSSYLGNSFFFFSRASRSGGLLLLVRLGCSLSPWLLGGDGGSSPGPPDPTCSTGFSGVLPDPPDSSI